MTNVVATEAQLIPEEAGVALQSCAAWREVVEPLNLVLTYCWVEAVAKVVTVDEV